MSLLFYLISEFCYFRTKKKTGLLPYMGYIGMCGPKGYGFSAVLVINRFETPAISWRQNRRWFTRARDIEVATQSATKIA